jgi:uncharacterized protein YgbK (DUF1537 family)
MRGNIGAEIDILLDEFDLQASFIAPAFPLQGRTTVFGIHYVKGIPLAESEIGRDSRSPVNKSRLTELVAANSRYEVGHVDLNLLSQKTEELVDRIQGIIKAGAKHIVFDATNQTHLDLIAELAIKQFWDVLPVGAAGLAKSLTTKMQKKLNLQPRFKIKKLSSKEGNLLFICGSASETLKSQVKEFIGHSSCSLLRITTSLLEEAAQLPEGTTKHQLGKQVAHLLDDNDVVLQIKSDVDILPASAGDRLVTGLAEIVAYALKETRAGGIFLSGGDTASAVLRTISNGPLKLEQEIISGLVWGSIVEGPLTGLPVVTKAGTFGTATVLAELYRIWKTKRRISKWSQAKNVFWE